MALQYAVEALDEKSLLWVRVYESRELDYSKNALHIHCTRSPAMFQRVRIWDTVDDILVKDIVCIGKEMLKESAETKSFYDKEKELITHMRFEYHTCH